MAPEPGREAEREGEWVTGGTTVQPCFQRRLSASRRRMAWISDALREAEKEELEEFAAIAARWAKQESRRRKRVEGGCKFVVLTAGAFWDKDTESKVPGLMVDA